ncbi:MAG: hypothetical protein EXQ96_06930 [Alphaproteobacteria bacterium]|nr:hypothetical protein [Alphaproteobacteria bacterium]
MTARGVAEVVVEEGASDQFDIAIDGRVVYSRAVTGGFPSDAEVDAEVDALVG